MENEITWKTWAALAAVGFMSGAIVGITIHDAPVRAIEEAHAKRVAAAEICTNTRNVALAETSRIANLLVVNEISQVDAIVATNEISKRVIDVNKFYHCER